MIVAGLGTAFVALVMATRRFVCGPYAITLLGLSELARIVVCRLGLRYPRRPRRLPAHPTTTTPTYYVSSSPSSPSSSRTRSEPRPSACGSCRSATTGCRPSHGDRHDALQDGRVYALVVLSWHRRRCMPITSDSSTPAVFAVLWTIRSIASAIVGGQATILGPIVGAILLSLVSEQVWARDPNLYQVIFGGIIALVVLILPGRLIALAQRWTGCRGAASYERPRDHSANP